MKRNLLLTLLLTLFVISSCSKMTQEERFKKVAELENLKCPKQLSYNTRYDSTHYDTQNNCVSYYYTLSGKADNPEKYNKNYNTFRKALEENVINSIEMKAYIDYKTTIKYIYYSDSTKKVLAEFIFNE